MKESLMKDSEYQFFLTDTDDVNEVLIKEHSSLRGRTTWNTVSLTKTQRFIEQLEYASEALVSKS